MLFMFFLSVKYRLSELNIGLLLSRLIKGISGGNERASI